MATIIDDQQRRIAELEAKVAEARARAVSDVVEEIRRYGTTRMNAAWLASHIEKWAADRKAGT
jgi:hypothetical protein